VALGIPLALGEQAPFLERRIPAVRFGTAPETARPPGTDELGGLDEARLGRLGRAVEATLAGLDAAPQLPGSTRSALVLDRRAISGWALELLLLAAVVPFGIAAIDLLARCRRRGTRLVGAWRAFRRRLGFWLAGAVALGVVAALGALPVSTDFPPRPDLPPVDSWPAAGIGALVLLGLLAWLRARLPLARTEPVAEEVELAGWAVALLALLGAAVLAAIANPYTLAFMLPSLYGWLALLQVGRERAWLADLLYAIGLLGPVVAVAVLSQQLELGFRAPLYAAALITSGTVPWLVGLALAVWLAVGAQVGALVTGRYSPVRRQRSSAR
jgi:hypothetical protein